MYLYPDAKPGSVRKRSTGRRSRKFREGKIVEVTARGRGKEAINGGWIEYHYVFFFFFQIKNGDDDDDDDNDDYDDGI